MANDITVGGLILTGIVGFVGLVTLIYSQYRSRQGRHEYTYGRPPQRRESKCGICQREMRNSKTTLNCTHEFHLDCLRRVVDRASPKCPYQHCRTYLDPYVQSLLSED